LSRSRIRRRLSPDSYFGMPVVSRADAARLAVALRARFGTYHAVVLLGAGDRIVHLWALTDPGHRVTDAAAIGLISAPGAPPVGSAYLLSGRPGSVAEVAEADLEQWRSLRSEYAAAGLTLRDWLVCDPADVRSLALTEGSPGGGYPGVREVRGR
jgi:hypothetical protein